MKQLTVIIPFLNEGMEVRNTIKSLKEHSEDDFDILLINDCSSDGVNYKEIALEFKTYYIEHKSRMGVATSRDEGVEYCKTPYFLLLDAHMRVFQNDWVNRIVHELNQDNRCLLCGITLAIDNESNIDKNTNFSRGMGAYVDFSDLSVKWLDENLLQNGDCVDIPCVLGASYACNKEYWKYLKGLEGLESYGYDEQYISLKVWLEGGKCKLMKNVTFGHIFREHEKQPYEAKNKDFYMNQLMIAEFFYKFDEKKKVIQNLRKTYGGDFLTSVVSKLSERNKIISEQRRYYDQIFTKDMLYIKGINEKYNAPICD